MFVCNYCVYKHMKSSKKRYLGLRGLKFSTFVNDMSVISIRRRIGDRGHLPPKNRVKYLSGKYHAKFWHFLANIL